MDKRHSSSTKGREARASSAVDSTGRFRVSARSSADPLLALRA